MGINFGSNVSALSVTRRLAENTARLGASFERLSSGLRINKASDDAAGLSVASGLNLDKKVFTQAIRNANDGVSMLAIAEGAVGELSNILVRLRELATQSANGSLSLSQRKALDEEAFSLTEEYNRITASTDFNNRSLLSADLEELGIQLGFGTEGSVGVTTGSQLERATGLGTFTTSDDLGGADSSEEIVAGDFNEDGIIDLAIADGSVTTTFLGNGDGTFTYQDFFTSDLGISSGLQIGDYNGDGHQDLIAYVSPTDEVQIFLGDGAGNFTPDASSDSEGEIYKFNASADFNGDGTIDVLVARDGSGGSDVVIGYNDGDGNFTFGSDISGDINGSSQTIGDFNGDGIVDIVAGASATMQTVTVLINDGQGNFTETSLGQTGKGGVVAVGDLNHDGFDDIVSIAASDTINVFLSNGDGAFSTGTLDSGAGNADLELIDLDGDGYLDLLASDDSGKLIVGIGNGDGTFQTIEVGAGTDGGQLTTGDFNQDGVVDAAVGSAGSDAIFLADTEQSNTLPRLNLLTQENALSAIPIIDAGMERVASEAGAIGALVSRLSSAVNSIGLSRDNLADAESRIVDVDVAQESANLVRAQILQEASAAVLSQANQIPSLVLALLE